MRPRTLGLLLFLALNGLLSLPAAEASPRSSFPGRRLGGGTRGECSAGQIVHLVPESSVYAPGAGVLLAVLKGPAAGPYALEMSFRGQSGTTASSKRVVPAGPAAVVLLQGPSLQGPTVWESGFVCSQAGTADAADQLQVVTFSSPPALTLLVQDTTPADASIRAQLQQLQKRCGSEVSRAELVSAFGLGDLLDASWPAQLPVRCPS